MHPIVYVLFIATKAMILILLVPPTVVLYILSSLDITLPLIPFTCNGNTDPYHGISREMISLTITGNIVIIDGLIKVGMMSLVLTIILCLLICSDKREGKISTIKHFKQFYCIFLSFMFSIVGIIAFGHLSAWGAGPVHRDIFLKICEHYTIICQNKTYW